MTHPSLTFMREKKKPLIIGTILLSVLSYAYFSQTGNSEQSTATCTHAHHYINPELDCINTDAAYAHIRDSEEKTRAYVAEETDNAHATRISVFFRDLQTKRWYGINENEQFSPGSLLKLPLAIAYYKLAEVTPDILTQEFVYKRGDSLNTLEHFDSSTPLIQGKSYSINDMLGRMLKNSDNDVVPTLAGYINKEVYQKVFIDLGVDVPTTPGGINQDFFSAKIYAAILRTLYNASYLNPEQSEKVLAILSQSSFTDGLVAGLPKGTLIAHKFGERTEVDPNTKQVIKRELHDCGIVYRQDNPYILCVMTEGQNFDDLQKIIADISRIAWESSDQGGSSIAI